MDGEKKATKKIIAGLLMILLVASACGMKEEWARYQAGEDHYQRGEYDLALNEYEEFLAIARQDEADSRDESVKRSGNKAYLRRMAISLDKTGNIYIKKGQFDRAIVAFQEIGEIADKLHEDWLVPASHTGLGYAYLGKKDYDKALEHFTQARNLSKEKNLDYARVNVLMGMGSLYFLQGSFEQALSNYHEALDLNGKKEAGMGLGIREADPKTFMAHIHFKIAQVHYAKKKYERAIEHLEKAREINREFGRNRELARNLYLIGQTYQEMGQTERAEIYFEKAKEAKARTGLPIK